MVYVEGGTFTMGVADNKCNNTPVTPREITVKPFFMDKTEVSREQYKKFLDATGHAAPPDWVNGGYAAVEGLLPVTNVTWKDVTEYAKWAGKRIPTEAEWEFAARNGKAGWRYSWGNDPFSGQAQIAAEGAPPLDKSREVNSFSPNPFGLFNLSGNVWEWAESQRDVYPDPPNNPCPECQVLRGGSYEFGPHFATTTCRYRYGFTEQTDYSLAGFRCAADVPGK